MVCISLIMIFVNRIVLVFQENISEYINISHVFEVQFVILLF